MAETWSDEEYYYDDEYYDEAPRLGWSNLALILSGLVGAVIGFACACCGLGLLAIVLLGGDLSAAAEATAVPHSAPTPMPSAPPFEEIRSQMETMTDVQWDQYAEQLKGATAVDWTGWVDDVDQKLSGQYELKVDMDPPEATLSISDVSFIIPDDLALRLQKDQPVTFSGQIDSVQNILGSLQISLVNATLGP